MLYAVPLVLWARIAPLDDRFAETWLPSCPSRRAADRLFGEGEACLALVRQRPGPEPDPTTVNASVAIAGTTTPNAKRSP